MDDLDKGSAPGSVEMVSAKRTASFDEDCEDEMALFARHDKALDLEERRKKPLLQRLFIPLLAVLIVLIVVVAVLSGVFSTSRGSGLEDCTPQKVEGRERQTLKKSRFLIAVEGTKSSWQY